MDKTRWREISFTQKTNFLYFTTHPTSNVHTDLRTDNTHTDVGDSTLISEICYTIRAINSPLFHSSLSPFFTCFWDWKKLSASTYLKYSVYRENLTTWNQFWEFYQKIANRKNKQKAFNKYYLSSAWYKIFRKTYVSISLRNFSKISKNCPQVIYFFIIFLLCNEPIGY